MHEGYDEPKNEQHRLHKLLNDNGYHSVMLGKWHLGDIEESYPHKQGFDEAFFTGTAAEVLPIREYDGRIIGEGKRGPVTTILQDLYFKAVKGELPAHTDWLAPVK